MDSMRSLNHSLPKPPNQPPKELLQAFKTAALEVTNLYKYAAAGHEDARRTGYQEAVSDLLSYLDKENLGTSAGEGWQVRQWAKDRLDGAVNTAGSESDDDREVVKRADSPSPALHHTQAQESSPILQATRPKSPLQVEAVPTQALTTINQPNSNIPPRADAFTFRSGHSYPTDVDMQRDASPEDIRSSTVRTEPHTKPSRSSQRSSKYNTRATSGRSLGPGGGSKRKFTFGDYFDIGNFGDGKDASGGSSAKRGRTG